MTAEFRSSRFVDFNSGDVFVPPMELAQQLTRPWSPLDKIEIFECRVEVWQLGVAAQILREMEDRNRKPIWCHAAYGLIAIISSYFEMVGKILNLESKKRGTAGKDFTVGFCDVYPQYKPLDGRYSPDVAQFCDRVRNGMYHLAYTKRGLWIHHDTAISLHDFDTKLPSELPRELGVSGQDRVYLMDPHRVTRTLVDHFAGFILRLRQSDLDSPSQAKFEEFFDDFHSAEAEN